MVAEDEQAAPLVEQPMHDAERFRAVRSAIGQVPELDDETVRGDSISESRGVTMHIADNAQKKAGGKARAKGRWRSVWHVFLTNLRHTQLPHSPVLGKRERPRPSLA